MLEYHQAAEMLAGVPLAVQPEALARIAAWEQQLGVRLPARYTQVSREQVKAKLRRIGDETHDGSPRRTRSHAESTARARSAWSLPEGSPPWPPSQGTCCRDARDAAKDALLPRETPLAEKGSLC